MNPLISPEDVPGLPNALVLDVRGAASYLEGHWPGAVELDVKRWEALARTPGHELDRTDEWEREFGQRGIDGSRPVWVYDDGRLTEAARVWFILQLHGVDARVIDGGWSALFRTLPASGPEVTPNETKQVTYRVPAGYEPAVKFVTRQALRDGLLGQAQILDARTTAEYSGVDLRANSRGGHLPGAKPLPHAELIRGDGKLRNPSELRERLAHAQVDPDKPLITHCDAGGRAALAALAAVATGHRDVSTYYLSYSDWAADDTCPVSLS